MLVIDDHASLHRVLDMDVDAEEHPPTPRRSLKPRKARSRATPKDANPTLSRVRPPRPLRLAAPTVPTAPTALDAAAALSARVYPADRDPAASIAPCTPSNAPASARGAAAVHRFESIRLNEDYEFKSAGLVSGGGHLPRIDGLREVEPSATPPAASRPTSRAPHPGGSAATSRSTSRPASRAPHPPKLHSLPHSVTHHIELQNVPLATESDMREVRTDLTSVLMPDDRLDHAPDATVDRGRIEEFELFLQPEQVNAAARFSERHILWHARASRMLHEIHADPEAIHKALAFDRAMNAVRNNRLYVERPVPVDPPLPTSPRNKHRHSAREHRWSLDRSIWAERKQTSSSRDYFETPKALGSLMRADWAVAQRVKGLYKDILRSANEEIPPPELVDMSLESLCEMMSSAPMAASPNAKATQPGGRKLPPCVGGPFGEVSRTLRVLSNWAHDIYGTFDFYSAAYSLDVGGPTTRNETDIFNMSLNAYYQWARDTGLLSPTFGQKDLDVIWAIVNAPERGARALTPVESKARLLNRNEFLQALVRIAIIRHPELPASEAVNVLCEECRPKLPREAVQSSNDFRQHNCYLQLVSNALLKHETSLRALFDHYASVSKSGAHRHDSLLSCGEWLSMLQDLGILQARHLTLLSAKLLFLWSRIRSAKILTLAAETKLRNLTFEDFLEALVRLSEMMALPTDAELSEAHAEDAGQWLLHFADGAPKEFDDFVSARHRRWWQPPLQRAWRCLDHMLAVFVRTIENATSRDAFGPRDKLSELAEVKQFEQRRRLGKAVVARGISRRFDPAGLADVIVDTMESVEEKTLTALSRVALFGSLDGDQLRELRESMVEAVFLPEDYVYEQGDHGDTFYVILEGRAAALRIEMPEPEPATTEDGMQHENSMHALMVQGVQPSLRIRYGRPTKPEVICLCELEEEAFFGERCLLHDELRFASMKALTRLRTLCITRDKFEQVLGPLKDLVSETS